MCFEGDCKSVSGPGQKLTKDGLFFLRGHTPVAPPCPGEGG